jgi:serine/threonine-protein kinase
MNTLFKKFEIKEVLKKDDHASVYLAHHIYLDKDIILKVLSTDKIENDPKVERFKREAKLLAKLDHPSIIKVLDFGTEDQNFYISFEYFKSENLRTVINGKTLTYEQKEDLSYQLLQALYVAHKNGIIHRDIKPENILIGSNLNLKLGDFGLALAKNENFVTSQYSVVGTPCYMSPEQMQGESLDFTSDLFSAGVVIYELFTDKNPLLGNDVNQTINNVINFDEEIFEIDTSEIPEKLKSILRNVLRKEKSERNLDWENLQFKTDEIEEVKSNKKTNRLIYITLAALSLTIVLVIVFIMNGNPKEQLVKENLNTFIDSSTTQNNIPINDTSDSLQKTITELNQENLFDENKDDIGKSTENKYETIVPKIQKGNGSLSLVCFPWADVYINNKKIDTTPLTTELETGTYLVKLVHPDYPIYTKSIKIIDNEMTNIQVNLDTLFGYLNCRIFPWGEVFIDNQSKGNTPFSEPLRLNPGMYQLKIRNPEFDDYNTVLEISKNDTFNFEFNFKEYFNAQKNNWNRN